jgi:hypothetical protein
MSGNRRTFTRQTGGEPYAITKERLRDGDTDLTGFFFRYGANIFVLSYTQDGVRKHTFVDAGDSRYRDRMLPMLVENGIEPTGIERIIITHRHHDHCGLAHLLASESGARVMVHANFRPFVEGAVGQEERRWMGDFNPSRLSECNIEYLAPSGGPGPVNIGGVDFPGLVKPMALGEVGRLQILACPDAEQTHSPDQLIIIYSPRDNPYRQEKTQDGYRPTDDIVFSGDLWLMKGPMFYRGVRDISRQMKYGLRQIKGMLSGGGMFHRDPREQDSQAKEALKRGFSLVRVEPGHGEEFLGSRLIPGSLLADRDLLVGFGYSMNASTAILKSDELAPRVTAIREQGYANFTDELLVWRDLGYTPEEITGFLVRIYREQSGGGPLVEQDRRQRRKRLRDTLSRLRDDEAVSGEMHQLAISTLVELKRIA